MRLKHETARIVGVLMLAVSLAFPVCSLAAETNEGSYDMDIVAEAFSEGDQILSVVVPSSVSIVIQTSVVDGHVMGISAADAQIKNSELSFAPISVELNTVADMPATAGKLLQWVNLSFIGQHEVVATEGQGLHQPLFDAIAPGEADTLSVNLSQKDADQLIPAGSYAVHTTLMVRPVGTTHEKLL